MNIVITKRILVRAIAFSATAVFSLAIMNSLPRIRQQRQRSFAQATMDGRLYRMRWLHFAGANVNAQGGSGAPLFVAAGEGNLDVVRYLLDEGANVEARDSSGATALAEAAYNGHLGVVKELLLRGADINSVGRDGTALDLAASGNKTAVVDLLKHHGGRTAHEIRDGG